MNWNYDILQLETQVNKKIMAFRMYKERGLEYTDKNFPNLHKFILANANCSISEVEKKLYEELEIAKLQLA